MSTKQLIEGLQTLQPFYDKPDGYNVGANHDMVYAYATNKPLTDEAIEKMISLTWHQEYDGRDYGKDFSKEDYRDDETWHLYV